MATFDELLNDDTAVRNVLVEVNHDSTTKYLSSQIYFDSVANRRYLPIVRGSSVKLVESLGFADLDAGISFGDIELENKDGAIDGWLDFIFTNRDINVYIGGHDWARADYVRVFTGVVSRVDSRSSDSINLVLKDKLERLNFAITETKLGGSTPNKDELIPLTFGQVHNVKPLLINPATLQYQYHIGDTELILEVRDNGVPVSFNDDSTNGKFTLNQTPFGNVTCSLQGDDPSGVYHNTVKSIIERLVLNYGNADTRFVSGDLDSSNLSAFNSAHPQAIGAYYSNRENLLAEIKKIAASVGAQVVMSRDGKLQLHKVDLTSTGTIVDTITTSDIVDNSLFISGITEIEASVKLGYGLNHNVQTNLETGIPEKHKSMYAREWFTVTKEDSTVRNDHKLDGEPVQEDTYLIVESEANTECQRRLDNRKVARKIITFEAYPRLLQRKLGEWVTVVYPRFGLDAGKPGVIIGLSPDWVGSRISVDVIIK